MKKAIMLGVAALGMWACSEVNIEDGVTSFPDEALRELSLATTFDGETRVQWVDGEGVNWEEGVDDTMLGFVTDAGDGTTARSTKISLDESGSASFAVGVNPAATRIFSYYPYKIGAASANASGYEISLNVVPAQTQNAAGAFSLAGSANDAGAPFVSKSILDISDENPEVKNSVTMLGAIVRFIVYSTDEELGGETVQSVTLTTDDDAAVCGTVKVSGDWESDAKVALPAAGGNNEVKVTLANGFALNGVTSSDASRGIYMSVLPATASTITYTVETDAAYYTFTSPAGKTFADNMIYNLPLNLASDKAVRKEKETFELRYRWFGSSNYTLDAEGTSKNLSYFEAYLNGEKEGTSADATPGRYLYTSLNFEVVYNDEQTGWLNITTSVDWVHASAYHNLETTERSATVNVYFTGDKSIYRLENPDAPVFSFTVTQEAGTGEYDVTKAWYDLSNSVNSFSKEEDNSYYLSYTSEGIVEKQLGWIIAYDIDDPDTKIENGKLFSGLIWDCDADWISFQFKNGNNPYITVMPNTDAYREATVRLYYPVELDKTVEVYDAKENGTLVADGTVMTFTVKQQSGLPQLVEYEWSGTSRIGLVSGYAQNELNIGKLLAYASDGVGERTEIVYKTWEEYPTSKYYSFDYNSGDDTWLTGRVTGDRAIHAVVAENNSNELRMGTMEIALPETEGITVVGGNTIKEIFVLQYPQEGKWFRFSLGTTLDTSPFVEISVGADGATNVDYNWFSIYINDETHVENNRLSEVNDELKDVYTCMEFTASEDAESWLSARLGNNNHIFYTCEANTTGAARVGYIYGHLNTDSFEGVLDAYKDYLNPERAFVIKVVQAAN